MASQPRDEQLPSAGIFRAYDIRGVVGDSLTESDAWQIGRAVGSTALDAGQRELLVAGDGRHSSPALREAIMAGAQASGIDVVDIGAVPTPVLYYATHVTRTQSGVMVTGSHNPPDYNGFKIVVDGAALSGERITALHERLVAGDLRSGNGTRRSEDVLPRYIQTIAADVSLARPLKVVADCGNGIAGRVAPELLEAIGAEVVPLYCEVDGDFPNHHPDPAVAANLDDLIARVQATGADLGLAFDGDGDRVGVVTNEGEIIWPDRLLMLLSQDVLSRQPGGQIIYDVKCSRHLGRLIREWGGQPLMWRTGHSHMKAKLRETGALLAGEYSGHICFRERWYGFDDGLYSAVRLLEILAAQPEPANALFAAYPDPIGTPEIKVETSDETKFQVIEQLADSEAFGDGERTTIDGIRIDYADGWGLIRASNTSPVLTLRFEADTQGALERIQDRFRTALQAVDASLDFNDR